MNKKTHILILFLALIISTSLFSQKRGDRKKIKALKVSYITEKLNLTAKEAADFWPIYNRFEKERYNLYHGKRSALKKRISVIGGLDKLTEKQAKVFAKEMLAAEKAEYEAHVKFQYDLSKIISYKKIVKLDAVERDFNRRLFRRYKNQKVRKLKKENR
ncbi:MAG: sensor of ECF-type sigma factor [Flavobacteriaceae bacterium]|nr:sensor of ECF-type sigma factor [Flavobacteriaceae bacterium]